MGNAIKFTKEGSITISAQAQALEENRILLSLEVVDTGIGIHTGPVITGVLGDKKSAFDIWGDTVNIASRMESFGAAGQVNISKETYCQIKDLFLCQYRGPIEVKNKGQIDMYFVLGIKPEYSRHQDGILPNSDFYQALG